MSLLVKGERVLAWLLSLIIAYPVFGQTKIFQELGITPSGSHKPFPCKVARDIIFSRDVHPLMSPTQCASRLASLQIHEVIESPSNCDTDHTETS